MSDAERIWGAKSDDELLEAAAELDTYTDEGQRVIRDELRRRGLEDPVEQAEVIEPEQSAKPAEDEDEPPVPNPRCDRCHVEQRYLGARRFREGSDFSALGLRANLFEMSQSFDVYVCPRCGHVDMFVDRGGEETRPDENPPES